jgi:hypothetical protein
MNDDQPFRPMRFGKDEKTRQFRIGRVEGPAAAIAVVQQIERRSVQRRDGLIDGGHFANNGSGRGYVAIFVR